MWLQHADITDKDVLEAIDTVPRHEFVPERYVQSAYEDHPLPIGYGQTISQPYIVALMTQLLELKHDDKVLEIGTGSGYQTAILARLASEVYSVEIVEALAKEATKRLQRLGYKNVKVKWDDGYTGWEEYAPYDTIIVTAAPDHVPQPLIDQLKDGGRLVIPVGAERSGQRLQKIVKHGTAVTTEDVTGVVFVPFTRKGGTDSEHSS
jgi:protein-L-isoaspartate(D-aspartate) O-methyltransferase